jgi:hypothetical protein
MDGWGDVDNNISRMAGSFDMTPPVLDGAAVSVSVVTDFVNKSNVSQLAYERGQILILADDSQIFLDADNGNFQSAKVTVTSADGSAVDSTVNWSTWHDALAFEPPQLSEQMPFPQPDGDGTLINLENYRDVLKEAINVYTGVRFGHEILDMPNYPMPEFPEGFLGQSAPDGYGEPITQTCINDGSAVLTPYKFGYRQITSGWKSEFSNCLYNGRTFNGTFYTREFGNYYYFSPGFTTESGNGVTVFAGALDYKHTSNRDGGPSVHYSLSADIYASTVPTNPFELTNTHLLYDYTPVYRSMMNGNFTLSSSLTGNHRVLVSTPDPMVSIGDYENQDAPPLTHFQSGLLVIDAGNGNSLWLKPSTDDVSTFDLTIFRPDEEAVHLLESWTDWEEHFSFNYNLF